MKLFRLRLSVSQMVKSHDWTEADIVLSQLKTGKSPDLDGIIYKLFRPDMIGKDLFNSLLMLCNNVKRQMRIPQFITSTSITSIYKNKGSRFELENDRGIFGVSKRNQFWSLGYSNRTDYKKLDIN